MPLTLTPYKILAILVAMLLLIAISLFGGWHIRGWHDASLQLKQSNADINRLAQQFNGVINASNALAGTISVQNQATENSIAGLVNSLGAQSHALDQIQTRIRTIPVGTCTFTPDADGLYQRAYQTAFGTPSHPAAQAGKAGGGDATDPSASPSHRYQ